MGMNLSRFNPFESGSDDSAQLSGIKEMTYVESVETKFLELITEAHKIGTIYVGRADVIDALNNGIRGLVFFDGETPYSSNIPVTQLCMDKRILYHVFASGKDMKEIVQSECSVVMVKATSEYYPLYDLCRIGLDILRDY